MSDAEWAFFAPFLIENGSIEADGRRITAGSWVDGLRKAPVA